MSADSESGRASAAAEFVRRVHRRRLAWRVVEYVGLFVLIACGLAAAVLTLVTLRGPAAMEPLWLTALILALAATCGAFVGLRRAPSLLDTAIEIDRQLRTPDLLSSALLTPRSPAPFHDSQFALAVHTLADARIANVSPTDLLLRRYTPRAWGGVALAIASVVTLALLVTTSSPTPRVLAASADSGTTEPADRASDARAAAAPPSSPGVRDRQNEASGNGSQHADSPSDDDRRENGGTRADRGTVVRHEGSGGSTGSSETDDHRQGRDAPPLSSQISPARTAASDGSESQGGVGRAARNAAPGAPHAGIVLPDHHTGSATPAAPWTSKSWPTDRAAARRAVDGGSVPPTCRDLVREYFDLD